MRQASPGIDYLVTISISRIQMSDYSIFGAVFLFVVKKDDRY